MKELEHLENQRNATFLKLNKKPYRVHASGYAPYNKPLFKTKSSSWSFF